MEPEIAARLEGLERTIMAELRGVRGVLDNHTMVDRENFEVLGHSITALRAEFTNALRDQDEQRRKGFADLASELAEKAGAAQLLALTRDSDRAKGALWAVCGLLSTLVVLAGVGISALTNYLLRGH